MSSIASFVRPELHGIPVAGIIANARVAIVAAPASRDSIWQLAEYVDLARPGFIPRDPELYAKAVRCLEEFVAHRVTDATWVEFWERADCLSRLYRKALRNLEQRANQRRTGPRSRRPTKAALAFSRAA